MEKRRRARINASLTELKSLLLAAIKKEGARQNKMEKADILEMAVRHLRHIQRHQFTGEASSETSEASKYQLGFHACVQEVCKYLDSNSDEDVQLKTKLLNHLANCVTAADCPIPSTSAPSSSVVSSSPSSYAIKVSVSPKPSGQASPSSCDTNNSLQVQHSSMSTVSSQSSERPQTAAPRPEIRPAINIRDFGAAGQQRVAHSVPEGILHAVLTSSPTTTNSALVKANMASVSSSGNHLEARHPEGDRHCSSHISSTSSESNQSSSVTEINNNSIILPALVNMAAPSTFTCVQQPHPLQQTQIYQQQQQFHHPQLQQQQLFPSFADGPTMFASSNPLQLIPTKTVNGDIAFLLSTANLVSSSQIPSFSIPIITQGAVGHTQILAPPIPQQAIQIAVSYPPDDQQQPVTFIANSVQPVIQQPVPSASVIHSSIAHLPHQTTPLNLSSSTQHAQQTPPQVMPKRAVALPKAESKHCDRTEPHMNYPSTSPAARQTELSVSSELRQTGLPTSSLIRRTGSSEADSYSSPSYNIKSVHGDQTGSMQQTPSLSWHNTAFANPGSVTFTKQSSTYKPETDTSTRDTHPGASVYSDTPESRLADWPTQLDSDNRQVPGDSRRVPGDSRQVPGDSRHVPGNSRQVPDDSRQVPGNSRQVPGNSRQVPDDSRQVPDDSRQVYNDSRQVSDDSRQIPGDSGLSTQRHFFRPWRE